MINLLLSYRKVVALSRKNWNHAKEILWAIFETADQRIGAYTSPSPGKLEHRVGGEFDVYLGGVGEIQP